LKLVNIETPRFSAGCGGIDFYAGGFSAIDSEQFIRHLRAIGQNASSLAFMLAIQIVSPQLSGIMKDVQTWAHKYLTMNLNSCEVATELVGGAMELFGEQEGDCTVARMQDYGEDWTKANYACTTGGGIRATETAGHTNKVGFTKGNLAWYVLMHDPFFAGDTDMAEMVMNLTGTIIIDSAGTADDAGKSIRVIRPAIRNGVRSERFDNIYKAMLYGAGASTDIFIYRCRDVGSTSGDCMVLSENVERLATPTAGIYARIRDTMRGIVTKIRQDTALTNEELGLISSASFPLYRFLSASTAYFPSGTDIVLYADKYTKLVAEDILLRSLIAMISTVKQSASMLPGLMSEAERVERYVDDVDTVLAGLSRMSERNVDRAEELHTMQERIRTYEQALMTQLGERVVSTLQWAN